MPGGSFGRLCRTPLRARHLQLRMEKQGSQRQFAQTPLLHRQVIFRIALSDHIGAQIGAIQAALMEFCADACWRYRPGLVALHGTAGDQAECRQAKQQFSVVVVSGFIQC